jgi:uncharacterized protein
MKYLSFLILLVFVLVFVIMNCSSEKKAVKDINTYTAEEVIEYLNLVKYPGICGGYFKEEYRSDVTLTHNAETFNAASMIYHLIQGEDFTPWRKYTADEIFFYLSGTPQVICYITPEGEFIKNVIGNDYKNGEIPMVAIPAGSWLSGVLLDRSEKSWGLVGLFVVPGWAPTIFENKSSDYIIEQFPHLEEKIRAVRAVRDGGSR